jgi:YHS domain-containing protein|uniref:YHS domain-containing protein n=1 Tax=Desulfobacca acetoxidans TaxID=60893 RepID=A0A7C3ZCS3_9BACT
MLFRLILGLILGYVAYRVVRRIKEAFNLSGQSPQAPKVPQPDVLVQDPVCQTFIPRQEALKFTKDGQDYFFCSEGCLKRFQRAGESKTIK